MNGTVNSLFKFGTILSILFSILLGQTASMPDTVAFVGGNVSIPVIITDVVELEGLEFTVQYDETILTAMSTPFENTELDGMNYNVSVALDIIGETSVVVYAGTNQIFSGSGTLLFINFDDLFGNASIISLERIYKFIKTLV